MYSKEEASKLRQQFWITFGKYMKPILSAEGLPINWVNYKTGVKQVCFKMDVSQSEAIIAVEISHPDQETRDRYFDQFKAFKSMFLDAVGEEWKWEDNLVNEHGAIFSRISKKLSDVSIFNQTDWPTLISFLKPRIIALDQFWVEIKPIFEQL